MVYPEFDGNSFWAMKSAMPLMGKRSLMPPLGLLTVAALLPDDWRIRLIDNNIDPVADADIAAADLVMISGMMPQRASMLDMIERAHRLGRPIAVGGPDVMSSPELYDDAEYVVTGEGESVVSTLVEAWHSGEARARIDAEKFTADVTTSPVPRFDLIRADDYMQMAVQYSRGCPFTCEFCDIIELFGRRPRTKTSAQMLAELDRIYALGHRGSVNFVDDNLIGNKKAVKAFLPDLIAWQRARKYPFDFYTEASLNLSDDPELMTMMARAGFMSVFIGIESPDPDLLEAMRKKQNMRRDIVESIDKVYAHGIQVIAGFIVGFDGEKEGTGDTVADLIDSTAIPVSICGLLFALPGTQLSRRLEAEGRLHDLHHSHWVEQKMADQCSQGLNFDTDRPRVDVLRDYRTVIARSYTPENFHRRVRSLIDRMGFEHIKVDLRRHKHWSHQARMMMRVCWALGVRAPRGKRQFWGTLRHAMKNGNPHAFEPFFMSLIPYAHLEPFSHEVLRVIDERIANVDAEDRRPAPARMPAPQLEAAAI
ncbi:B12-binding domain-containing radical SAM protein [Acuticoccus sediminis]|uniref:B12-binding domain-containing radical SAM protein n=2 Tax=Acuticoccus sediminis TaxID=2184697 RepID=A0A8B2NWI1_9HYPH|nr:radical SAM protein [Acuticoccus sediminis]RAI04497.1 B12-binding domain-containing radical SAM protein [Acuticoccus sediminis]